MILLLIHERIRRIDILRLLIAKCPSAEGDDIAHRIEDREHKSSPEQIEDIVILLGSDEDTGIHHLIIRISHILEMLIQCIPAQRRITYSEMIEGLLIEPSSLSILSGRLTDIFVLIRHVIESGSFLKDITDTLFLPLKLVFSFRRSIIRYSYTIPVSQIYNGFTVIQTFHGHDKAYRIAALLASETLEYPLRRINRERRRLLIMERTKAPHIGAL